MSEPKPIDLVTELDEALHGTSVARDATPQQVWLELLHEVRGLKDQIRAERSVKEAYQDQYAFVRRNLDQVSAVLRELVILKDGPRNAHYKRRKPVIWSMAREVLGIPPPEQKCTCFEVDDEGEVMHADGCPYRETSDA